MSVIFFWTKTESRRTLQGSVSLRQWRGCTKLTLFSSSTILTGTLCETAGWLPADKKTAQRRGGAGRLDSGRSICLALIRSQETGSGGADPATACTHRATEPLVRSPTSCGSSAWVCEVSLSLNCISYADVLESKKRKAERARIGQNGSVTACTSFLYQLESASCCDLGICQTIAIAVARF